MVLSATSSVVGVGVGGGVNVRGGAYRRGGSSSAVGGLLRAYRSVRGTLPMWELCDPRIVAGGEPTITSVLPPPASKTHTSPFAAPYPRPLVAPANDTRASS